MTIVQEITRKIQAALPEANVIVADPREDGVHLEATVICPSFAGQPRLQRHRAVYAALGNAFSTDLHALKLTTQTPEEANQ